MANGKYHLADLFANVQHPNQAIFINHLRTNPNGVTQITGELVTDDNKSMCALGMGLEAFDMIKAYKASESAPSWTPDPSGYDVYDEIASVLHMPKDHVEEIYALNDDEELTFGQIADILVTYFAQKNLYSAWTSKGPSEIYAEMQSAVRSKAVAAFTQKWDAAKAKHDALLAELAATLGVEPYELREDTFEDYSAEEFYDEYVDPDRDNW